MNLFIHIGVYTVVSTVNLILTDYYYNESILLAMFCILPLVTIVHIALAAVDWVF